MGYSKGNLYIRQRTILTKPNLGGSCNTVEGGPCTYGDWSFPHHLVQTFDKLTVVLKVGDELSVVHNNSKIQHIFDITKPLIKKKYIRQVGVYSPVTTESPHAQAQYKTESYNKDNTFPPHMCHRFVIYVSLIDEVNIISY